MPSLGYAKDTVTTVSDAPLADSGTGATPLPLTDLDQGIVGWDSQEDPSMPLNFPKARKWILISQVSAITFISPLATTIVAPAASYIDADLDNSSAILSSFVTSIYLLGYVVGPLLLGPASEIWGRRPVMSAANWSFVVWQVCCARAPTIGALIGFRFLAGIGGAGCMTLNGGVVADLFVPEERGGANAIAAVGVIFGPVLGPICGGFIAERVGWRWVFWTLCCAGGVISAAIELFNRESYAPVLIARKTARLAKALGRSDLRSAYESQDGPNHSNRSKSGASTWRRMQRELTRPLRMLFLSPLVALFSTYMALIYGLFYLLLTTITTVYQDTYHWSPELTGLAYLGPSLGFLAGLLSIATTSDRLIVTLTARNGGVYEPEMRLPFMVVFGLLIPGALFWYGWTADRAVFWLVPLIGLVPFGFGMLGIFFAIQMYMIDAFPRYAASAMAAVTVSRSLLGALLPLAGPPLYDRLGLGWGNSLLGFIALAMVPVPYYLWKTGRSIRLNHPIEL
ncbi:MFS transporter [Aspergillus aculeatinus CBS 121060]|uniref:MFS general substrate transporter n=1 Tax=Aspergillus aculeatinus CBS 121060 TaxID=1448322 RepID=A0ACD1GYL6_9EURO|nr:MFS general substrate transporter [Aspergillus aculeatinus CBS 121060]RAH66572.1 MFS general substrate transporter [Aspergillus aculeatinus CBS 121060]